MALVGHTGDGKSTRQPDDGLLPAEQRGNSYRRSSARFTEPQRLAPGRRHGAAGSGGAGGYLYANVTLGRDISEAQVWEALESVQLAELARGMSEGIYTQLGEQGNNLSVGQKQLLALARVLVDTPQILILDEATANIDSGTEQAIQQALAKVRQHTTLVVIAHRLSTIVEADTILVLHRGQAVERGNHQQLLAAKGATGKCISCSWLVKSWLPARRKSRLLPDAL